MIASGGIGGNHDLVRRNWPTRLGAAPGEPMLSGVPDCVDGSMLEVAAGGRRTADQLRPDVALPRGDRQPRAGLEPPRHPDPGRSFVAVAGCARERLPAPLFPGFDALGALRHITASGYGYSWFVLDQAT